VYVGVGGVAEIKVVRQSLGYGKENGPDKLMFTRERAAAPEGNVSERICADVEESNFSWFKCLCFQYFLWEEHRIFF
jgi:hypothetical protein